MNELFNMLLLLSVPLLPLLLVFPALRLLLPKAQFVALLPAVIVVVSPVTFSAEMPWLMFGSEMELDGFNRLLLAMSVLVWAIALKRGSREVVANNHSMTFVLLAMAGNFGAIVAADLLLFFGFTTLMGYAFYALLMASYNAVRRVARVYLWLMIVADILLFEVLLLLAVNNTNLSFASANTTMAQSPLLELNLWLVLLGFMLKAGIWPVHYWLSSACRGVKPALALLLVVAPVSMSLLGLLRWLPLGEINLSVHGFIVQGIGVSAMLYAFVSMLKKTSIKIGRPVHGIIFMTGLFFLGIGTGLADAATWGRYEAWGYYFIVALGFVVLLLITLRAWKRLLLDDPVARSLQAHNLTLRFERFAAMQVNRVSKSVIYNLTGWRAWWLAIVKRMWWSNSCYWQNILDFTETKLSSWPFAITLYLLLGIVMVFIHCSC